MADDLVSDEIYLELIRTAEAGTEQRWVKYYEFKICRTADSAEVGHCDLRLGNSERLIYSGNIGYTVFERYRGRGYALKACLLLFEQARKHGTRHLYINCASDNTASRKTCEYAGAELVTIIDLPAAKDKPSVKRQTCIYRAEL